jgi:membrane-associated phospholipid phosphatase
LPTRHPPLTRRETRSLGPPGIRWLRLLGAVATLAVGASSRAEGTSGPAYALSLDVDAPLLLIAGASASSYLLLSERGPLACAPRCDPSQVNAIDRPAAGLYNPTWAAVGNVATATVLLAAPLALLLGEGPRQAANDILVVGEAALVTTAIQVPLSAAINRPRPWAYGNRAPLKDRLGGGAGNSFFSGHVANTVAVTVATMRTFQRLHLPALAWTALAVGLTGSAFIGVARVASGNHFPTDVLAGAALGAGVGFAVPALHAGPLRLAPWALEGGGGLRLSGAFF